MNQENVKYNSFRVFIAFLAILLTGIMCFSFYRSISSVTDENAFQASPRIMVTRDIDAELRHPKSDTVYVDTLKRGDFVAFVNDSVAIKADKFFPLLKEAMKGDTVKFRTLSIRESLWIKDLYVASKDIKLSDFESQESIVFVTGIKKDGASDIAGMKLWDMIIAIDGKTFKDAYEADQILQNEGKEKPLTYTILRNGKKIDITINLARYGISFNILLFLISGMLTISLGLYIGLKRPELKTARLTSMGLVLIGFLISFVIDIYPKDYDIFSELILAVYHISFFIGIPVFMHSTFHFPDENKAYTSKPWIVRTMYLIGILGIASSVTLYYLLQEKQLYLYFGIGYVVLILLYVFIVKLINKGSVSKEDVRRGKAIRWAMNSSLVIVLFVSLFFLTEVSLLPSDGIFTRIMIFVKQYSPLLFILIPLAYLYTIGRYQLLGLNIRIRRNIQYFFIVGLWRLSLIVIFISILWIASKEHVILPNLHFNGSSLEVLKHPLAPDLDMIYQKILLAGLALVMFFILRYLDRKFSLFVNNKYYRFKFDFRKLSEKFSELIQDNHSLNDLSKAVVQKLGLFIGIKSSGVMFFKDGNKIGAQSYDGIETKELSEFFIAVGAQIIKAVENYTGAMPVEYLPEKLKTVFESCGFKYVFPILNKGNLIGIIITGEKQSETAYHADDMELFTIICNQVSIAAENAFLYEDLAKRERMKHELDLARKIQLASLPPNIPEFSSLDISGKSVPALEVGGDFYDFLNGKPDKLTVVVGDVSGKGTSAALYMSKAQGILRTLSEFDFSPQELFIKTNTLLYKSMEKNSFISVIGAKFDINNKKILLSRAGHLPLYLYRAKDSSVDKLIPKGIVLGISKENLFDRNLEQIEISFEKGDIFLFVTDGVVEARNFAGEEFDGDKLLTILKNYSSMDAKGIRDTIINEVEKFAGANSQYDDMTVVVVKVN